MLIQGVTGVTETKKQRLPHQCLALTIPTLPPTTWRKVFTTPLVYNERTFSRSSSTLLLSNTTSWKGSNFISEGLHRLDKTASCDMDFIFSTPMNTQD